VESEEEARYRLKLAEWHFSRAEDAFGRHDSVGCVRESQLCAEESAKAVIACFRLPSPVHDPSDELLAVAEENADTISKVMGETFIEDLKKVGEAAKRLAPAHIRSVYGEAGRPPWEIYDEESARDALELARGAYGTSRVFIEKWFR